MIAGLCQELLEGQWAPAKKLRVGLPVYEHNIILSNPCNHEIHSSSTGPGSPGSSTSLGSGPTMRHAPGNHRNKGIGGFLLVHKFNMKNNIQYFLVHLTGGWGY